MTRIGELGSHSCSSETLILTRATPRNTPEAAILHSHRYENLKAYETIQVSKSLFSNYLEFRTVDNAHESSDFAYTARRLKTNPQYDFAKSLKFIRAFPTLMNNIRYSH
jgi:hypothetical protein